MKERAKRKATFLVTVLMLAVLLGGLGGGVLYEKAKTEPVITLYKTEAEAWQRQHDQVLIEAANYRQSAEEYREALAKTVVDLQIAQREAESYQVALVETKEEAESYQVALVETKEEAESYQVALGETKGHLDEVSETLEVTQQERSDLLRQVENWKQEGYILFASKTELWEYVKSTGISQRKYVSTTYDCDDFAIDLVVQAYKDKRMIGLWGYPGHLKNFAIVGNEVFGVEPQNNRISIVAVVD